MWDAESGAELTAARLLVGPRGNPGRRYCILMVDILNGIGRVFCWFNLTLNTDHVCIEGINLAIIRYMPAKKHTAPIRCSLRFLRTLNNIPAMTANDMAIPTTIILGMGCLPIRDALRAHFRPFRLAEDKTTWEYPVCDRKCQRTHHEWGNPDFLRYVCTCRRFGEKTTFH